MTKFILIILLIVNRIMFSVKVNILDRDFSRDLNIARSALSNYTCSVASLSAAVIKLTVRWMIQVKISGQIVLSFFFFSWRNSVYNENGRRNSALFSGLETSLGF